MEADQFDHGRVLEIADPYPGDMVGTDSAWPSLQDGGGLFAEAVSNDCPWQFETYRVV